MRIILLLACAAAAWGQAAWSPASVANCQLWLRADDLSLSNGASVSTWASRCGSHTATAVTAPTFATTGGPNGHAAVAFNGTNQSMTIDWTGLPLTVFALYQTTEVTTTNWRAVLAGDRASGDAMGSFRLLASSPDDASNTAATKLGGAARMYYSLSSGAATAGYNATGWGWCLLAGGLNGTSAFMRQMRTQVGTGSGSGTAPAVTAMALGSDWYNHVAGDYLKGSIAEVIAYDRALSSDEIAAVESYLENRYFNVWKRYPYTFYGMDANFEVLSLQGSTDGLNFAVEDTIGEYKVRDPSIIFYKGKYWMAVTGCHEFADPNWGVNCSSKGNNTTWDLYSSYGGGIWKWIRAVTANPTGGTNSRTWAPDWFIDSDGSLHVLLGLGTTGDSGAFALYEMHPTDEGLTTWSAPTLIDTSAINSGNTLDAYAVKVGSTYYLSMRKQGASDPAIVVGQSSSLTGPYSAVATVAGYEGPAVYRVGSQYRLIAPNAHPATAFKYQDTSDFATWSAAGTLVMPLLPNGQRMDQGSPRRSSHFVPVGATGQ